ncbi:quinoprotein relay system zinc metallohydrolase 2 [Methylobacterium currus]|uniref:Quinoprotein relay system zinc metallohydrolase 2 n=1 Tax=Methylobacterium currus TaxID=2051553 RepID=A0A2R4WI13_9HYPH|nr:quinoprotein relay system zinc metallohydrolase 2 [Methylobacterium currus]AWB21184.1 quinoprotein relay system zinc metallohydrolase 2 [Methylobacterium currus]UHC13982.1 quinoprotein relay system zinc metallohydrolase 2 [Methylobacterium currus]
MRAAAALLLVLALLGTPARAEDDRAAPPLPVQEVAPGIFVYAAPYALAGRDNDGAIANVGFVIGREAVAVIDTGGSLRAGQRLRAALRQRTALPVRYVINTHVHPDHVLGNAAFAEAGTTFVGHHALPEALAARAEGYLRANADLVGPGFAGTRIVPPTLLVSTRLDLDLGGRVLHLEAWPTAHTNSDLTVRDAATDTWFLGDLLFVGHVPALDGRLAGWIATLRALRARPAARVVPGHGPAAVPWPAAAGPIDRYLAGLEAQVRAMVRDGTPIGEAGRAAQGEAGEWALFDDFNARNATTAYQELEWE